MKSAIYNLYESIDSMKKTIDQIKNDTERNKIIVDALEKVDSETLETYGIDSFIDNIKEQINHNNEQLEQLQLFIEKRNLVIEKIEKDDDAKSIVNDLLVGFGFKEEE